MNHRRNRISVVILCHNQAVNVSSVLRVLNRQTLKPYEVIIADDNSCEPVEVIAKRFGCKYVRTQKRAPHVAMRALARQLGTLYSSGDMILYLDGDIIPSRRLLELVASYHENYRNHVVVKVPRKYHITTEGRLVLYRCLSRTVPARRPDISFWECTSDCFSVERDVIMDVGGWDINFTGWGEEDIELAYRFFLAGIQIISPAHPVLYCVHIDHPINHQDNFLSLQRNALYFAEKHSEIGLIRASVWESLNVYSATYMGLLP